MHTRDVPPQHLHNFLFDVGWLLKSKVSPYRTALVLDLFITPDGLPYYYMEGHLMGHDYDGGLERAAYVETNYTYTSHPINISGGK